MAEQSLAVKYRPTKFEDVTEQGSVVKILKQQAETGKIQHAYLFSGGAGTGKTTCARIFANEINHGNGAPVEIDAARNNSVDDARIVIQQAKQPSLDGSEYRVYIYDECHMLSESAWNAMLKILEEPPKTAVFIFCTTDPQKIPKTILSRVQRYDFQRISQKGIVDRLAYILGQENLRARGSQEEALEYIAKLADGGMRDAITLLDKCLAYDTSITLENVVKTVGTVDYGVFFDLTESVVDKMPKNMIELIESIHSQGKDLKLFIRNYLEFMLDICKYDVTRALTYTKIPNFYEEALSKCDQYYFENCYQLLKVLITLNADIKWDSNPKSLIEAKLIEICMRED